MAVMMVVAMGTTRSVVAESVLGGEVWFFFIFSVGEKIWFTGHG